MVSALGPHSDSFHDKSRRRGRGAIVTKTISRLLEETNMKSKRTFRALPLAAEYRRIRLQLCQAQAMRNATDWKKMFFSEESRFVLSTYDNAYGWGGALVNGIIRTYEK